MTVYEDEIPARRRGVGTKVLGLACGILAILGSFWGIVWFIRSYVEPPRVMVPAGVKVASRDTTPVVPATPAAADPTVTGQIRSAVEAQAPPPPPAAPPAVLSAPPPPRPAQMAKDPDQAGSVADRWGPINQFGPAPAPPVPAPPAAAAAPPPPPAASAPAPADTAPAALATPAPDRDVEEVAEGSIPAFDGPAPLPRRRPVMTAQRRSDPPLPRPRPDGQLAPQSVFIAVPTTDDRYPTGQ